MAARQVDGRGALEHTGGSVHSEPARAATVNAGGEVMESFAKKPRTAQSGGFSSGASEHAAGQPAAAARADE